MDTPRETDNGAVLEDGASVAVVGGGPAGSFFAYFLLTFAKRVGLDLTVTIYEPRDFGGTAPTGCNMCGGIISESLVQMLAAEGIELPGSVIQRGIDSYVLHMDVGTVRIETPVQEMRIGAVHRGAGPRDLKTVKWGSFDGYLQSLAESEGAKVVKARVEKIRHPGDRPVLELRGGETVSADLVAVATGVNSSAKLLEELGTGYEPPGTAKAYIREYYLGEEAISASLGSSMHVFLPDIPQIEFAAIIPKGDYATLCLLGDDIDREVVQRFMDAPWVHDALPTGVPEQPSCQCGPRLSVTAAHRPYADRMVFVGDCGVTRLYKDGIGAAYRTAKAAAAAAVFRGVSEEAFRKHYGPACRRIQRDNGLGRIVFRSTHALQKARFARRAVLEMTQREQRRAGYRRRMSLVLWNVFTGSEPYRQILLRTLHPGFFLRLGGRLAAAAPTAFSHRQERRAP